MTSLSSPSPFEFSIFSPTIGVPAGSSSSNSVCMQERVGKFDVGVQTLQCLTGCACRQRQTNSLLPYNCC
jgi:hypothetical protein